jgi:hypothetical protein
MFYNMLIMQDEVEFHSEIAFPANGYFTNFRFIAYTNTGHRDRFYIGKKPMIKEILASSEDVITAYKPDIFWELEEGTTVSTETHTAWSNKKIKGRAGEALHMGSWITATGGTRWIIVMEFVPYQNALLQPKQNSGVLSTTDAWLDNYYVFPVNGIYIGSDVQLFVYDASASAAWELMAIFEEGDKDYLGPTTTEEGEGDEGFSDDDTSLKYGANELWTAPLSNESGVAKSSKMEMKSKRPQAFKEGDRLKFRLDKQAGGSPTNIEIKFTHYFIYKGKQQRVHSEYMEMLVADDEGYFYDYGVI